MQQKNAIATWHVNYTVSIVTTIRYGVTCEVLSRYDDICKGWTILHRNITCIIIRERKNKGTADRHRHSRRRSIGALDWKWTLEGNGVSQNIGVVRRAYVCTGVTLCLMLNVGIRQWQGLIWLLDPLYRMHNEIRCCFQNVLVDGKMNPLIFCHRRKPA
jgi:hypothetical protein